MTTQPVISASRNFVCIRLATYENKDEAEYLKSFHAGKSDDLENTVFCFLSPNGKDLLSRATRGPQQMFRDAADMASYMNEVAAQYDTAEIIPSQLPKLKDVRLGLNVAECDGLPLVVAFGEAAALTPVETRLTKVAFSDELRGRFVFATTTDAVELQNIGMADTAPGIYAIDPDEFGLKGTRLAQLPLDASLSQIEERLATVADDARRSAKDHRRHVKAGDRAGIQWQSEIPVTDPGSMKAMERRERFSKK